MCAAETRRVERAEGIPEHLLRAISLAETGRWDAVGRASFAWPWTVTAEGRGEYFPTKAAALAYAKGLAARGVRNFDLGCMQINMYHHGGAFASLDEALDPAGNVAYGATYLKGLYQATNSWIQAAAFYHSTTPEFADRYRDKVERLWRVEREAGAPASAGRSARRDAPAPIRQVFAPVDSARTMALNARLRQSREAPVVDASSTRQRQLAAWRAARVGVGDPAILAVMQRARMEYLRRQRLQGPRPSAGGS